jgi:hypothetical protein
MTSPPQGGAVLVRPANAARSRLPLRGQAGRKASTPPILVMSFSSCETHHAPWYLAQTVFICIELSLTVRL